MAAAAFAAVSSAPWIQPVVRPPAPKVPVVVPFVPDHTPTWEELGELAASLGAVTYGCYHDSGVVTVISGSLVGVGVLEGRVYREGDTIPNGPVWNPSDTEVLVTTRHPNDQASSRSIHIDCGGAGQRRHACWLARQERVEVGRFS